ncbi:MAG: outer membrane beta-barrel protein [Terriglobales bacterium]
MLKRAGMAVAVLLLLTAAGLAQEDGHFDVSIGGAGVFTRQSSGHGIILDPTNSAGPLISFRVRFNAKHSIEANYSHTYDSQIFTVGSDIYRIRSAASEFGAAYVYNPVQIWKFEPFVLGGLGRLGFKPGNTYINTYQVPVAAVSQSELGFIYGGGVDYRVVPHVAVRLQYRGLIYRVPDFKNPALFTGALGQMAEPSVGVVIRF